MVVDFEENVTLVKRCSESSFRFLRNFHGIGNYIETFLAEKPEKF